MYFLYPAKSLNEPNARKIFKYEGKWNKVSVNMPTKWNAGYSDAQNLSTVFPDLMQAAQYGAVMIHGTVKEGVAMPMSRKSAGKEATILDVPLNWVAMDIDDEGIAPPDCETAEQSRSWWIRSTPDEKSDWYHRSLSPHLSLPSMFDFVRPIIHLSSSCFVDCGKENPERFRGHLFFRLSSPVSVRYWKEGLAGSKADLSKYGPEHILYLSNPGWQDSRGVTASSPWGEVGPNYAWHLIRIGHDEVKISNEVKDWKPREATPLAYSPSESLPQWRNSRWWVMSGIEPKAESTPEGNRHEVMKKQAVKIGNAITARECDESVWNDFMRVWLEKGMPESEIKNMKEWVCKL